MPNYIAAPNAPQPAARPVVDVGDIINQVSNAWQANKNGVLHRAVLQQRVAEQKQAQARQDAQFQLEQQRFQLAQRQQQTQEQMHASELLAKGYEDVTGQPETTGPDGITPAAKVTIGERAYRLNPNNTPDARKKSDRLKKLQAYNDALPATDPKRLQAEDIDLLSNDDNLFNTFTTHRLGLTNDPYETHKKERLFDIGHPLPTKAGQDPEEKAQGDRAKWILSGIHKLTMPQPGKHGRTTPGLSRDAAIKQLGDEWDAVHGEDEATPQQTSSPPPQNPALQAEYDEAAHLYQQALKQPGVAPEHARQLYSEALISIAKKYGQAR